MTSNLSNNLLTVCIYRSLVFCRLRAIFRSLIIRAPSSSPSLEYEFIRAPRLIYRIALEESGLSPSTNII